MPPANENTDPVLGGVPTPEQANEIFDSTNLATTNPRDIFAQVGANTANIMLVIAGILVVTMAIYSGLMMILSQGDEAKVEKAKKQLLNALLATAVLTLTFGIIAFIKSILTI